MGMVLCGASAFAWWRTPPFVRRLMMVSDPSELGLSISPDDLRRIRNACWEATGTGRDQILRPGRPSYTDASHCVLWTSRTLWVSGQAPYDVLFFEQPARRPMQVVRAHTWKGELPPRALVRAERDLSVTSPAFTLLQLAGARELARVVALASELAGSFAVYEPPGPVRTLFEEQRAAGTTLRTGEWRPTFDAAGRLMPVWQRSALVTPEQLAAMARACAGRRGCRRLAQAAELVVPGAASPFEVQTAMLLGLPEELGGAGLGGFSHNERVDLGAAAQRVARRSCCYCDLFWPGAGGAGAPGPGLARPLDLECKSAEFHANARSYLSDADRAAALQLEGVDVLELTYAQLADELSFESVAQLVALRLGRPAPGFSPEFARERAELRRTVLSDWGRLAQKA